MTDQDEAAKAVLGGIADDQSRQVMVEFNGIAAHQIYHDETAFERLLRHLIFTELWVSLNARKIKSDDLLIVRDSRSSVLLGIFTITDIEVDNTGLPSIGRLALRPLYIAS